ncbi:MAG: GNAT family N-acetyltransferase [Verrucomicrobiales bacterium]|nr:GNAT family N-acetyltransferase [Verrucomicrobiales bacterium]
MRRLSYQEFQEEQSAFGEAVARCGHLARFCSDISWQCAAYENLFGFDFGLEKPMQPLVVEQDDNWLVFSERRENIYYPFEAAWMFGCPVVGAPVESLELLESAAAKFFVNPVGFVISGILEDSQFHREVRVLGERSRQFDEFGTTDCLSIDLSEGVDAFLGRRSRSFRKGIRQMKPLDSLEFEDASSDAPETIFPRILAIQSTSYKAKDGGDIFSHSSYERFYRSLYQRLYEKKCIRTLFARCDGQDVAYIMGGVSGSVYRGFQMSYDNEYRKFALGNRLQLENIQRMCEEGVTHYDLGMHSPYKERWADNWESYKGVFVVL